jgi:hypothetical protein
MLLDAVNLDQLREARDLGKPLTAEQERAAAELEEKARHWPVVIGTTAFEGFVDFRLIER